MRRRKKRVAVGGFLAALGLAIAGWVGLYAVFGWTPAITLLRNGGALFLPVDRASERLSPAVRLVLAGQAPQVRPGPFVWHEEAPGFAAGEMGVLAGDVEVDRLLLTKVDPARFRIVARNDASATTSVEAWLRGLGASVVINGSYYATTGRPDTPFVAAGEHLGPMNYQATQGALVVGDAGVSIVDLSNIRWQDALSGARDAMVSYPLLLGMEGKARPLKSSAWLANRTFVGLDRNGWVIFGTTKDAFFSLDRLARFLETTPLALGAVLNLDGGPISCQAAAIGTFTRDFCGAYEIQASADGVKKLSWLYGRWALPIALAAIPR